MQQEGYAADNAVLVDDRPENVSAFRVFEGKAILFKSRDSLVASLVKMNVPLPAEDARQRFSSKITGTKMRPSVLGKRQP